MNNSIDYIKNELSAIKNGLNRKWSEIARLLVMVEDSESWKSDASSLSDWIRRNAALFGLKEPSLWRFHSVAKNYENARSELIRLGVNAPCLEELTDNVSPESLELLLKLQRVVPDDELIKIATRVLTATISRNELRKIWQVYRHLLEGHTSRGRNVAAPRIDKTSERHRGELLESKARSILLSKECDWLSSVSHTKAAAYTNVSPFGDRSYLLDSVVAAQGNTDGRLYFHGIEIKSSLGSNSPSINIMSAKIADFCDFVWLVVGEITPQRLVELDHKIGVIVLVGDSFRVLREAKKQEARHSGELAKAILLQTITG